MFQASSCPSSGATTTAIAASALPSEPGGSSAVGRGRAYNHGSRSRDPKHIAIRLDMYSAAFFLELVILTILVKT
jgi:hypothetical protein